MTKRECFPLFAPIFLYNGGTTYTSSWCLVVRAKILIPIVDEGYTSIQCANNFYIILVFAKILIPMVDRGWRIHFYTMWQQLLHHLGISKNTHSNGGWGMPLVPNAATVCRPPVNWKRKKERYICGTTFNMTLCQPCPVNWRKETAFRQFMSYGRHMCPCFL